MNNELVNVLNDLDEIKTDKSIQNIMQIPSFFPDQFKCDTGIIITASHIKLYTVDKKLVNIITDTVFKCI